MSANIVYLILLLNKTRRFTVSFMFTAQKLRCLASNNWQVPRPAVHSKQEKAMNKESKCGSRGEKRKIHDTKQPWHEESLSGTEKETEWETEWVEGKGDYMEEKKKKDGEMPWNLTESKQQEERGRMLEEAQNPCRLKFRMYIIYFKDQSEFGNAWRSWQGSTVSLIFNKNITVSVLESVCTESALCLIV